MLLTTLDIESQSLDLREVGHEFGSLVYAVSFDIYGGVGGGLIIHIYILLVLLRSMEADDLLCKACACLISMTVGAMVTCTKRP